MFYTWISKKQIGVIYSNWKRGLLNLDETQIKWLYDWCAEHNGYKADNYNAEDVLARVKNAIDAIFSGSMEDAQQNIDCAWNKYNACFY